MILSGRSRVYVLGRQPTQLSWEDSPNLYCSESLNLFVLGGEIANFEAPTPRDDMVSRARRGRAAQPWLSAVEGAVSRGLGSHARWNTCDLSNVAFFTVLGQVVFRLFHPPTWWGSLTDSQRFTGDSIQIHARFTEIHRRFTESSTIHKIHMRFNFAKLLLNP